jgi:hypothetical protein
MVPRSKSHEFLSWTGWAFATPIRNGPRRVDSLTATVPMASVRANALRNMKNTKHERFQEDNQ